MLLKKLKVTAVVLVMAGLLGASTVFTLPESHAEPPAANPSPATAAQSADRQRLQGAWLMLALATDGRLSTASAVKEEGKRWTFHGDQFLVTRANEPGQVIDATYKLDPTKSPREMEYVPKSGSDEGQMVPAIYWMIDDLLVVADDLGTKKKPDGFRVHEGKGGRLMVFAREASQRRGSDVDFLNRICRELRGSAPTGLESKYYLADKDGAKRVKAIAWLLGATGGEEAPRLASTLYWKQHDLDNSTNITLNWNRVEWFQNLMIEPADQTKKNNWQIERGIKDLNNYYLSVASVNVMASATAVEDAKVLRRTMLDLIGRLPTPLEVQYYVADKDTKKRDQILEWLVKTDEHARHSVEKHKGQPGIRAGDDTLSQLLDRLLVDNKPDDQVLEALSLAVLAREPSETEKALIAAQVAKHPDRRAAWREVLATLSHLPDAKQHIDGLNRWREAK